MKQWIMKRRLRRPLGMLGGALLAMAIFSSAFAQEPTTDDQIADLVSAVDTGWLLVTASMVFFMQAGFAMVESGFVRSKNTSNILMKNLLDACVGGLFFWAFGYAIAFGVSGDSSNGFMGNGNFFLSGDFDGWAFWFFQFAFAATAATIVSGAMAERTKFSAYLVYTAFISGAIYPFVVHWAWDANGWLSAFKDDPFLGEGYIDFAGSGVVHMVGGVAALVGAKVVGPRIGKFNKDGSTNAIPGHNITSGMLGLFILWFGWYGFNPGSTLALSGGFGTLAGKVAVTTTLAAAAGAVCAVIVTKVKTGRYDLGLVVNGTLGGLVGITAGCATVEPWAAVVIGAVAAIVVIYAVDLLDNVLKIDDPVGAAPVHLFAGLWGVIAVGLFSSESGVAAAYGGESGAYGLLVGGGFDQFFAQVIGAAAIIAWTAVLSGFIFLAIKMTMGLRVPADEEEKGLDLLEHGIDAYPDFGPSGAGIFSTSGGK
ncbi:MAG: ammonium transporter [Dehalococcoidia bacterium]